MIHPRQRQQPGKAGSAAFPAWAVSVSCAVVSAADDPHAELLAMVWGSRFDREHAQGLIAAQPEAAPDALQRLLAAADSFDRLSAPRQQRLRRLIWRHRERWDNRLHAAHSAD